MVQLAQFGIGAQVGGLNIGTSVGINVGPDFINIPVPGNGTALYTLAIVAPGQAQKTVQAYTFPISPQQVQKTPIALSTVYDTAPAIGQKGVQRTIDRYGKALPYITIEGTTGWQRHSTDLFLMTGLQSIAALQRLFDAYEQLNEQQVQNNIAQLYSMEFYDYFASEFWQIEPIGQQGVSVDASRPLYYRYQFRWACVRNLASSQGSSTVDGVQASFSSPVATAASSLSSNISSSLSSVSSNGTIAQAGSPLAQQLDSTPGAFSSGGYTFGPAFTR